jgi:N-acetylmuramoyl-L-alanine amidase CwlA
MELYTRKAGLNMAVLTKKQWQRRKRRRKYIRLVVRISFLMVLFFAAIVILTNNFNNFNFLGLHLNKKTIRNVDVIEMFLTPNEYSRPQTPLKKVKSVVVHYTANPGTGAEANRNYFEGLKNSKITSASSHFVIGLNGEVIQCIPLDEISYASNDRNNDTISIECCHPDETGKFNDKTYESLVKLVAWVCCEYNLDKKDIIRHYDVSGKKCPLYFVEHEDEWKQFKDEVMKYIKDNAVVEE